jgi:hypothetical protein
LEILSKVAYFSEHELTRYGDLLFYQDELWILRADSK